MNQGRTVFSQLMDIVPYFTFERCVHRFSGDRRIRSFSCRDQFLCMVFAQLTYRESLRDIELCLRTAGSKAYHMGIRGSVSRNTLANANAQRDWRIYEAFAQELIREARTLYAQDAFCGELEEVAYALDSTTLDLCLSLFPWADFRTTKAAVKVHTLMDLRGSIPAFVKITNGKVHDVNILDQTPLERGALYVMDRGYVDFKRLHRIHLNGSFFVTRAKSNFSFRRLSSMRVDRSTGVRCDQVIRLNGVKTATFYPDRLRRVSFHDVEKNKRLVFITNDFLHPPGIIAKLYKCRWKIELFFKWIKQHLRIKVFFGTSENAVKTQIWIAITTYVLVAILKKRLNLDVSLHTLLQFLSVHLFEKTPILEALAKQESQTENAVSPKQLFLFDF